MSHQGISQQETRDIALTKRSSSVMTIISVVAGLSLLVLLAFAFFSPASGRPIQGDSAPDFTLNLLDGTAMSLGDLRGQVVVLNFWASWCVPCRQEAPALQEVWEMYQGKGVVFLGVSHKDAEDASRTFVQEFEITYPNGADHKSKISRAFGITGVPETFVIDPEGKVAKFYMGEVTTDELVQQLEQMMGR